MTLERNIDITTFMSMKDIKKSGEAVLDFANPASAKAFNDAALGAHAMKGLPRYWGFAVYQDKHNQASLLANPAIVLEYAYAQRQPLIARLTELGWNALVFNADRGQSATVVAVLPLAHIIRFEKDYTRAATVIADHIGLYDLLDGKSNTFLIQPAQHPKALLLTGKPLSGFDLNRDVWLEFATYQQSKPSTPQDRLDKVRVMKGLMSSDEMRAAVKTYGAGEHSSTTATAADWGSYGKGLVQPAKLTKNQQIAANFRSLADLFDAEGN